jgi:alpha-tubulin suppressor-like RCC1 family protein
MRTFALPTFLATVWGLSGCSCYMIGSRDLIDAGAPVSADASVRGDASTAEDASATGDASAIRDAASGDASSTSGADASAIEDASGPGLDGSSGPDSGRSDGATVLPDAAAAAADSGSAGAADVGLSVDDGGLVIALGDVHTCARFPTGALKCWGDNYSGELGYDTTATCPVPARNGGTVPCSPTPTEVPLAGVTGMSLGANRSYAWLADGTAWWWGQDEFQATATETPTQVAGLAGVVQVAVGGSHTCALLKGGTVWCWGKNDNGQLGDGTNTDSPTPKAVSGVTGVTQISCGGAHVCALAGGSVTCWGANPAGQLGYPTTTTCLAPNEWTCSLKPTVVPGLSNVVELSLGSYHSCARLADRTIRCWGDNSRAELGFVTTETCTWGGSPVGCSTSPKAVPNLAGVAQVASGMFYTCARLDDGTARCWGNNSEGQLGFHYRSTLLKINPADATTTVVGDASPGLVISLGWNDTAAELTGLVVYDSGSWDSPAKATVLGIDPDTGVATSLFETPYHTIMGLAKEPGKNAFYSWVNWTSHTYGEIDLTAQAVTLLGSSDQVGVTSGAMTYKAAAPWGPGVLGVTWSGSSLVSFDPTSGTVTATRAQLSSSEDFIGLAYDSNRKLLYALSQVALNLYSIDPATAKVTLIGKLDTNAEDVGGLAYDPTRDALYTMGLYLSGGTGCLPSGDACSVTPITVPKLGQVAQIAVYFRHTCARLTDGSVMCWGLNNAGQLGDGTTTDSLMPTLVKW